MKNGRARESWLFRNVVWSSNGSLGGDNDSVRLVGQVGKPVVTVSPVQAPTKLPLAKSD